MIPRPAPPSRHSLRKPIGLLAGRTAPPYLVRQDEPSPKELFLQSLERCADSEDFIPSFYERFVGSSEEIREKFRLTDFEVQNRMLLKSLRLVAGVTAGEPEALRELRARAETHDRRHLDIEPRLYRQWQTAIIETARKFDEKWDDDVEDA